jgi:acyl-coenzyme A synthetase/AMP-(fatty) acid ligase
LDGDGYLVLKGRAGDVVRRQGVEIFSGEIEATLLAHPTVRDAAVISSPSAKLGEALVAFVVSGAEPRHEELARHCRMNLPSDRWPDHVFYIDALPRNAAGKIERPRLRALAEARLAGAANA